MRLREFIVFFIAIGVCLPILGQNNKMLIIKGVNIIDGRNNFLPNRDILIENSIIKAIHQSGSVQYADSIKVLVLQDQYIIPGLFDSHIHLGARGRFQSPELSRKEFKRWIYSGVTTVREMGGDTRLTAYEKRLIARNEIPGPDIYYAATFGGPDMMSKDLRMRRATEGIGINDASWIQTATEDMDIALIIASVKGTQAHGIKLYAGIKANLIKRISDEAHRQGLKTWCHFTVFPDRPLEVVKAGVDVVSHVWGAFWQDPDVNPSERIPFTHTSFREARSAVFPADLSVLNADENEIQILFDEMVKRNVIWDVTYAVENQKTRNLYKSFLLEASKKGVIMCTGTDRYNDISEPFPSLYEEIEALVQDGILTNMQVIEAATFTGAKTIGIENTHGSIEEGKIANLIVLKDNPLEDIKAIKSIVLTIKNGQLYWRKDYSLN